MDHNAKDSEIFSSESSDGSWLPVPAGDFEESPATYESNAPSLQESNDSLSGESSSTASRPTFPPHIAYSIPPAAPLDAPTLSEIDVHDIQGSSDHLNAFYAPDFNPQLWNYPAFPIPLFGDNVPNAFTEPLNSFANNADLSSNHTLPYNQYIPPLGASEIQFSQWDAVPDLLNSISYSDTTLITSTISGPIQSHGSNLPVHTATSRFAPISTPKSFPKIAAKSAKVRHQKAPKKPKSTRRSGPLDARVREKAEEMRDIGACWRCKKYKKSCSGDTDVCDSCRLPGFRVWPSELGCRRERLESLVLFLLPSHMEDKLQFIPEGWTKGRTWRVLKPASDIFELPDENSSNQWAISKREARSLLLFDVEYVELASIAEKYQKTRAKPVEALEVSCKLLIAACKLYQCFIRTPDSIDNIEFAEMVRRATAVRIALRRTFVLVQQLCLSTKRTDWFPAFLSACLITCTAIVFIDTIIAVPSPVRELIYGDFHGTRADLRNGGYDLLVDLLRASTNGVNPIQQDCWNQHSVSGAKELQYSKDRQVLLGVDSGAMEGLVELKAWQEKYRSVLDEGRAMFAADAYALARIRVIAGLYKIFDF